jgi:hypothetical protein
MKPSLLFLPALAALFLLASCATPSQEKAREATPSGTIRESTDADWGTLLSGGRYRVLNNVWNKNAATGPRVQRVFLESLDGSEGFGWQWNWTNRSHMVVAYPEVVYGDKPWDEPSGVVSPFPVRAGGARITADFHAAVRTTGVCNMAFSLWCVSALPQKIANISHEIMIWTMNNGMSPAGKKQSGAVINGRKFDVYLKKSHTDDSGGSSHAWTYIAFAPEQPILDGPLVVSDFTDYLIQHGILDSRCFITSIELGNEIVSGSGCTELQGYSISVTGSAE